MAAGPWSTEAKERHRLKYRGRAVERQGAREGLAKNVLGQAKRDWGNSPFILDKTWKPINNED
jgi:hypothetical protein